MSEARGFKAKLMFIDANNDIWFTGDHSLVKGPVEGVKWFTDVDEALAVVRDTIFLNVVGVTQVRIISADFEVR